MPFCVSYCVLAARHALIDGASPLKKLAIGLIAACLFSSAASAQVLIIGSKIGKQCYDEALRSQTQPVSREYSCTEAIKSRTLSKKDLAAVYINRGIIRMRGSRFEAALEDYDAAKTLRPNQGAIYLNEGAAYIASGRPAAAIPSLTKALELETQDPHAAHYNLGLAHELTGDVNAAYRAFQKALELRPDWDLAQQQLERFTVVSTG